ncbi:hypothetical protein [Sphingomonas kyeonggiensis]|uniref:Uncharacterized protein n=1 Tax=Sphingomonas kyeonggiensis TaxID=1268553 RepID=A0A7W6NXZ0_9SPHN|nr:hypothetical protein [Sphingomonas kyeonggiensis]MBB4100162.1 hypothetical protein [Sphingomonas kyeonggiensis]
MSDALIPLADQQIALTQAGLKSLIEETSASYRWLMASMLAINGAAAAAVLNGAMLPPAHKAAPLLFFYIGTMAALAIAFFGQLANRAMIAPVGNALVFWTQVKADQSLDEARWREIEAAITAAQKKGAASKLSGWISAAAFSLGILAAAISVFAVPAKADAQPGSHSVAAVRS